MTALISRAPLPTPRWASGGLVRVGSKFFMIGGVVSGGTTIDPADVVHFTDRVDVYDALTDSWGTAAPLPRPNADHYAWTDGTYIYAACGLYYNAEFDGNDTNYFIYRYTIATDSWETLPLNVAESALRYSFLCGIGIGRKLYALRSFRISSKNYYQRIIVDLDTMTVSNVNVQMAATASSAFVPVGEDGQAITYGGKIYIVNGYDPSGRYNNLAVFDPAATPNVALTALSWPVSGLDLASGASPYNEALPTVAVDSSGFLWVIGGVIGTDRDRVWKYEIATDTWTQEASLPSIFGGAVSGYDEDRNQILMAGGRTTDDEFDPSVSSDNRALVLGEIVPGDEFGKASAIGSGVLRAKGFVTGGSTQPYVGMVGR